MGGCRRQPSVYADEGRKIMHTRTGRGSRGNSPANRRSSPEQTAASHKLALQWRDEWRAGKSAATARPADTKGSPAPVNSPDRQRAQFAEAITRLEFGRNYWDQRLQREVRERKATSPKLPRNAGDKNR
jgi:hypothetical protein